MKIRWNHRYVQLGVTAFLVIAASILFYYGIFHMKSLISGIKTFFGIMAPIIYGAAIATFLHQSSIFWRGRYFCRYQNV